MNKVYITKIIFYDSSFEYKYDFLIDYVDIKVYETLECAQYIISEEIYDYYNYLLSDFPPWNGSRLAEILKDYLNYFDHEIEYHYFYNIKEEYKHQYHIMIKLHELLQDFYMDDDDNHFKKDFEIIEQNIIKNDVINN